jgi:hypothetical protein
LPYRSTIPSCFEPLHQVKNQFSLLLFLSGNAEKIVETKH